MVIAVSILSVLVIIALLLSLGCLGLLYNLRKECEELRKKEKDTDAVLQYLYETSNTLINEYKKYQESEELLKIVLSTKSGDA